MTHEVIPKDFQCTEIIQTTSETTITFQRIKVILLNIFATNKLKVQPIYILCNNYQSSK